MAEAARRATGGHSNDVVRRLIARPIRLKQMDIEAPRSTVPAVAAPIEIEQDVPQPTPARPDATQLQANLQVLKAVLAAEREEIAKLRICAGLDGEQPELGEEARAVRERWAAMVDRLLHASA